MSLINRKILVVDDNEGLTKLLSKLLVRLGGHQVVQALDGPSALRSFEQFQPEIVLLDIGLPGMDGHEVATRIRASQNGHETLLVALTGFGEAQDRQKSMDSGFDTHLVKPASIAELEELFAHPKLAGVSPGSA